MDRRSILDWQGDYLDGKFDNPNLDTQVKAGWWDWFCKDRELPAKTERMALIVMALRDSNRINRKRMYVWFKNAQPVHGKNYDMLQISDIETGDVIWSINIGSPHESAAVVLYGSTNEFKTPLATGLRNVLAYLLEGAK